MPFFDLRTMPDRIYNSLARQRFAMTMLAAFAGFAMLLGGVGIYGVMSYLVTQGTHDIGVRIALGAPRGSILKMVVRQGMAMAGAGIIAGLAGALVLTRVMASLLFGVSTTDALTFCGVDTAGQSHEMGYHLRFDSVRLVITPDPYAGAVVPLEISGRELTITTFASREQAREAWDAAPARTLNGVVGGG